VRGDVSKNSTCWRDEVRNKRKKLAFVKLAICPDHPRLFSSVKFCIRVRVRKTSYIFQVT